VSLFERNFHGAETVMNIVLCFIAAPFHGPECISRYFKGEEAISSLHHEFEFLKWKIHVPGN